MGAPILDSAADSILSGPADLTLELHERTWPLDPAFDQLVDDARAGDRSAFRSITETLAPTLVSYLHRTLALDEDTASDIVQDAFVLAWCNLDHIRDGGHLRPWLYRVSRYRAVSFIRRQGPRGRRMVSLDNGPSEMRVRETAATDLDLPASNAPSASLVVLRRVMAKLKPNHAGVVRLHYLMGLDTIETARLLGVTRGTVKMRLLRARRILKRAFRGEAKCLAPQDAQEVLAWLDAAELDGGRHR